MNKRLKSIANAMLQLTLYVLILCLFTVALIEWAVGCGETYTDANGVTHAYECVIIPTRQTP
jgi:hypothetical protein